jgi:hypothetical protein
MNGKLLKFHPNPKQKHDPNYVQDLVMDLDVVLFLLKFLLK